jgi:hypothetical protein
MKPLLTLILLVAITNGCARFTTTQKDLRYVIVTNITANATHTATAPSTEITTRATAWTFWDSRSALSRFKAIQSAQSQSATVGELVQETSGTNAVQVLKELNKIISALPK